MFGKMYKFIGVQLRKNSRNRLLTRESLKRSNSNTWSQKFLVVLLVPEKLSHANDDRNLISNPFGGFVFFYSNIIARRHVVHNVLSDILCGSRNNQLFFGNILKENPFEFYKIATQNLFLVKNWEHIQIFEILSKIKCRMFTLILYKNKCKWFCGWKYT